MQLFFFYFSFFIRFYRAMPCMRGTSQGPVSVCICLCLCLSVTSRCSTKTAKHRNIQIKPHDSSETLVFCCQRSSRNSTGSSPYEGGSKSATFDKQMAISRKRCKIDAWFLLKSNRKSYALYRMVTSPMTLSAP